MILRISKLLFVFILFIQEMPMLFQDLLILLVLAFFLPARLPVRILIRLLETELVV